MVAKDWTKQDVEAKRPKGLAAIPRSKVVTIPSERYRKPRHIPKIARLPGQAVYDSGDGVVRVQNGGAPYDNHRIY